MCDARYQVPGVRCQVSGVKGSGVRCQVSGARYQVCDARWPHLGPDPPGPGPLAAHHQAEHRQPAKHLQTQATLHFTGFARFHRLGTEITGLELLDQIIQFGWVDSPASSSGRPAVWDGWDETAMVDGSGSSDKGSRSEKVQI